MAPEETKKTKSKSTTKKATAKKKAATVKKTASSKTTKKKSAVQKKSTVKKTSTKKTSKKITPKKKNPYALLTEDEKLPAIQDTKAVISDTDDDMIDPESLARGDVPMSIVDHLDEFRSRLLIILGTIITFTLIGIFFSDYLLKVLTTPFEATGLKLNIFTLTGGFIIRIKASFVAGLIIGIPVIIFQLWRFISPALGNEPRGFIRALVILTPLLFYIGVGFVFFGLLPLALPVLVSFVGKDMMAMIGADDYLSFIMFFGIAMGFLFELPIVATILTRMGIISPVFLIQKRKIAIVIIFVVAALVTPQDPLSQIMVAVPLMLLYEISIVISKLVLKSKIKREIARQEEE